MYFIVYINIISLYFNIEISICDIKKIFGNCNYKIIIYDCSIFLVKVEFFMSYSFVRYK